MLRFLKKIPVISLVIGITLGCNGSLSAWFGEDFFNEAKEAVSDTATKIAKQTVNDTLKPIRSELKAQAKAIIIKAVRNAHPPISVLLARIENEVKKSIQSQVTSKIPSSIGPISLQDIKDATNSEINKLVDSVSIILNNYVHQKLEEFKRDLIKTINKKIDDKVKI